MTANRIDPPAPDRSSAGPAKNGAGPGTTVADAAVASAGPEAGGPVPLAGIGRLVDASLGVAGDPDGRGGTAALVQSLLRLQRTAGNRAVQRLIGARPVIQRQTKTTWSGGAVPAAMLNLSGGCVPTVGNNVTVKPEKGLVMVQSSDINMPPVDVELDAGLFEVDAGKSAHVGFVQTVNSSERVGVYRAEPEKPGDAAVEFEQRHQTTGARRDAARSSYGGAAEAFTKAQAPFYLPPGTISKPHPKDRLQAKENDQQDLFDRPGFALNTHVGKARLVATKGKDSFTTSIGAKDAAGAPSALTHLATSAWAIPWDVPSIPDTFIAKGGTPTAGNTKDVPSVVEGPLAVQSVQDWMVFPSVAAAMNADVPTLLDNLAKTKAGGDLMSYNHSAAALRAKNPKVRATLTVDAKDAFVGRDDIRFWFARTTVDKREKVKKGGTIVLETDLNTLAGSGPIEEADVRLNILVVPTVGVDLPEIIDWTYPWSALHTGGIALGSGKYRIDATLA